MIRFGREHLQTYPIFLILKRQHIRNIPIGLKDLHVGDEALSKRGIPLYPKYPIGHGIVTEWGALEQNWEHNRARAACPSPGTSYPAHRSYLWPLGQQKVDGKNHLQFLLLTSNVRRHPGCFVRLCLRSNNWFNSGDAVTHSAPIYGGDALPHAIVRLDFYFIGI